MRAARTKKSLRVLWATLTLIGLAGCRIPGAMFGDEALNRRMGAAVHSAIREVPAPDSPATPRTSQAEAIILADGR